MNKVPEKKNIFLRNQEKITSFRKKNLSHTFSRYLLLVTPSSEAVVQKKSSVNKVSLEISKNSQENTCASLFFNKVAGIRPATLSKKEPLAQMSCCDLYYIYIILKWYFSKFLRTFFFKKHLWWLLLAVTFESIKLFTSAKHYESIF